MSVIYRSLSTIPNRYAFWDAIDQCVRRDPNLSLLMIDVVRFSDVSSSIGYAAGDRILVEIASRIKNLFGSTSLLGRISGDMFGLVIPGSHSETQLTDFYQHLVEHFKTPICIDEYAFMADFNVGAVANIVSNQDTSKLFSVAEAALKQAKESKYQNFHILPLREKLDSSRSLALKADLKRAFANDELTLYFQPKVDLQSMRIIGAECLLRWNHPLDGIIVPGSFIEAAESYNMMNELGYWVLEKAFSSALHLQASGIDLQLSMNISPTQLYDSHFVQKVRSLADSYGIDLTKIELELTEDVALSNSILVKRQLAEIKALGMSVAVDDFGKGYSNLAYLRDIELDTLKIDKTFVMGLDSNPVNRAIIEGSQLIAKAINCRVIAEGIETLAHLHILREIGIEAGQGFLFSKAVPIETLMELCNEDLIVGGSQAFNNRVG
ncbi:bifunctional diguanylate cyclase/phosphodiesterase [Aliiglaciecola sp. CAU 1673]|uniref:putative bifunctional diguanylate cyclase/phosphodiesterase n=1 Tax=Aliiglaciecola sp. CAU 1673 TaxID=3032595 RepID=UPI0023DAB073|nr:bifunctional diguanylate cyclase/phosphodiesterase [Aliiglaciecola sp. CAU 1673]MDF2180025.1 bifunctional diguanylate cyclase/phosphodiesterase [Aliiglaciecola sp. CAU 1673]